jgi:hypothetical protein
MFDPADTEVLWLNLTNIALGAVTLICLVVVGTIAFREIAARVAHRIHIPIHEDDHAFDLGGLGITMADGGERVDEKVPLKKSTVAFDESHIIRSDN